jgi:hypothetical protein
MVFTVGVVKCHEDVWDSGSITPHINAAIDGSTTLQYLLDSKMAEFQSLYAAMEKRTISTCTRN